MRWRAIAVVSTAMAMASGCGGLTDGGDDGRDREPPVLVDVAPAPGSEVWLHETFRLEYSEAVEAPEMIAASAGDEAIGVSATVDGDGRAISIVFDPEA